MIIFKNYTGNAMLNNALMTIEALADLKSVQDITPVVLKEQLQKYKTWVLYKRMKSYTMLFTRNNLLTGNDKEGWKLYKKVLEIILDNAETEGKHQCEISGQYFKTTFSDFYKQAQHSLRKKESEQDINRCFFPLIGSLGSDAQALPQAIYDIRIHPICLVAIQFLPLSALLYKGRILLFDTTSFEFARDFIAKNVERVQEAITITPATQQIENIKDFNKGKYLLRAIKLFSEKQTFYGDRYTDINLWSFTNSGTGPACEVDRIPSLVFRNLYHLFKNPECQPNLIQILNSSYANDFVGALKNSWDYEWLYPQKNYSGVSIPFFEEYQLLIGRANHLDYAKYIAGLMKQATLSKFEEKMLSKTDSFDQPEYIPFFQKILIEATSQGKWSLLNHLDILDDLESLPIKNYTYGIFKKVHFYYQAKGWEFVSLVLPSNELGKTMVGKACAFAIRLIEKDEEENFKNYQTTLKNSQEYSSFSLMPTFIRQCREATLSQVSNFIFQNYRLSQYGLNFLLRIYFSQKEKIPIPEVALPQGENTRWIEQLEDFAAFYAKYYIDKYGGDWQKFNKHVLITFPRYYGKFQRWLDNTFDKMREYYVETGSQKSRIDEFEAALCYDEDGNYNPIFTCFAVQLCLNQQYHFLSITK